MCRAGLSSADLVFAHILCGGRMSDDAARKAIERESVAQVRAAGKELATTEAALLAAIAEPLTADAKSSIKCETASLAGRHEWTRL